MGVSVPTWAVCEKAIPNKCVQSNEDNVQNLGLNVGRAAEGSDGNN